MLNEIGTQIIFLYQGGITKTVNADKMQDIRLYELVPEDPSSRKLHQIIIKRHLDTEILITLR